ncbi:triphosphoribosyl-dephospho-CoA synthase CitG [Siculibacillus lacustris]|uniref:Probable 2-(5''-triphosphoribosyl)-3'-dephosphocoenzyme-A synthase n=2 Tax=Siculibacillus lacustris TaxID=1549641 RepID=A0A4V2KT83_9HYPH|nr:triphosphoribosyl-dephospho-CoA synthase CitG [Siculibacillus lacustris]
MPTIPTRAPEPRPARRSAVVGRRGAGLAAAVAALTHEALEREFLLTPKPGLVDRRNTGSHRDMDLSTFAASAAAIAPFAAPFFRLGRAAAALPAEAVLATLRPTGLEAERAMYAATGGVNTHKGSIFAFGLAAAAAGRVVGRGDALDAEAVCEDVAAIAAGLVERELGPTHEATTAGAAIHRRFGLTGARGEAASGFATVRHGSLPVLTAALDRGVGTERALHAAFLHLLEHNPDTNLVARGGPQGAAFARAAAAALRRRGGIDAPDFVAAMERLDDAFIAANLSPGGSADLLALTWFLHRLPALAADPPPRRRS